MKIILIKFKQRFRFCGDADCPDWVLAEINTLSRLSSVKLKLLARVVAEGLLNPPLDVTIYINTICILFIIFDTFLGR